MGLFKRLLWYLKSDIELGTTTVSGSDGKERIDGFYFLSKKPFSKSYQWHETIGLENTYNILDLIKSSIDQKKKAAVIDIVGSLGRERIVIWRGSLKKAEKLLFDMISKIQKQY